MKRVLLLAVAATLMVSIAPAGEKFQRLADEWRNDAFERREFKKLLIVAITDDREARRNFENKFVSHLRGRDVDGVTSHSLVPDLTNIDDEHKIIEAIAEQEVDGAISIRVVRLKGVKEADWGKSWLESMGPEDRLRQLIEESLPVETAKSPKYGVEVALWDVLSRSRIWAARTDTYNRKQLRESGGDFVQLVMATLKEAALL